MFRPSVALPFVLATLLVGCGGMTPEELAAVPGYQPSADKLFVVDCLLPGQIRKLGSQMTYLSARRPIKTTAGDCEIRGGEYVAYDRANYATALGIWLPKAQEGDAEAQAYVGEIYEKGMGVPPDYRQAAEWYRKAAEQGNSRAQINLGQLYEKGLGVAKDLPKAMDLYQQSSGLAKQNIPYAATISTETAVPAAQQQMAEEIKLLKASLHNSESEAKLLSEQLQKTQRQLAKNATKLLDAQASVDRTRKQLAHSGGDSQKAQLESTLTQKEAQINQEKTKNAQLQQRMNQEIARLKDKLKETENRAERVRNEIAKQPAVAGNATQIKLAEAQAKLAETEKRLLDMKQEYESKMEQLATGGEQEHASQQQTIQQLVKERYKLAAESERLKAKSEASADAQAKLAEANAKLAAADQQLATVKQEYERKMQTVTAGQTSLTDQHRQDLSKIQQNLQQSEAERQKQEHIIEQLEKDKQKIAAEVERLKSQTTTMASADKPSIEIIEPPFVVTRGKPAIVLRSIVKEKNIIGKAHASAGIKSVLINEQEEKFDDHGLFNAKIALSGDETPVNVVAIDKNGSRSSLDFIMSFDQSIKTGSQRGTEESSQPGGEPQFWKNMDFGNYYALIIGNNKYQKLPVLDTPINDARAMDKVLREKYGVKTTVLLDANRYQILTELNKLRSTLTEKDNLIIYYAGHGELDKANMRGNWLPIDAEAESTANWISTIAITDILNAMSAKHILVIADSCYSGAMTRASLARLDAGMSSEKKSEWLKAMLKAKSRTVLTSGGLQPVMDGGGGDHSVFAQALLKALEKNQGLVEGQTLYRDVSANIVAIAASYGIEQVPVYAPIQHAGHESGEFFLTPKS